MTRLIQTQLASLKAGEATSKTAPTDASGIIYELYGGKSTPTTSLEDRLLKLERSIGSTSNNATLLQRLDDMERWVQTTTDPSKMEQTVLQAKVLRADLEAASKAKNKLILNKQNDAEVIQQLHSQLNQVQGLSQYLPSLVERLQQLASIHQQAGSFGSRLTELETSASQVEQAVAQVEATLSELQTTWTANMGTLTSNLSSLEERMKKL